MVSKVELSGVRKRYADASPNALALKDLDLRIEDGELLVIAGPSGCGKTTLLRVIAGLECADAGEIRINGRRVNDQPPARRDVAMVFQNHALYSHLSVRGNLGFAPRLLGVDAHEVSQRIDHTARLMQIDHLLDRKPGALSGGERQRAALAKALVRRPACLLLDEPLSSIDAPLRGQLRQLLKQAQRASPTTTLHVTHDHDEALELADRIAVMRAGAIEQIGGVDDIRNRPANRFVVEFFAASPLNVLRGRLTNDAGRLRMNLDGLSSLALPPASSAALRELIGLEVDIALQPEHLIIAQGSSGECAAAHLEAAVISWHRRRSGNLVEARFGDAALLVALPPGLAPPDAGAARFFIPPGTMHLFAADAGARRLATI
jgi:ABC-type sugar transport system ATPase subunit